MNKKLIVVLCVILILENVISASIQRPQLEERILQANWRLQDYLGMFGQNLTDAIEVKECPGICRTPIAIWVIHEILPCDQLFEQQMGCPKGFWCCVEDKSKLIPVDTSTQLKTSFEEKYLSEPSAFIQDDP